jgi:hypothetical protein
VDDQPDRRLDDPNRPQLYDALRPRDPVLDPRWRQPVHRRVRPDLPKRRHDHHLHATAHSRRERLRERWIGAARRELCDRTSQAAHRRVAHAFTELAEVI